MHMKTTTIFGAHRTTALLFAIALAACAPTTVRAELSQWELSQRAIDAGNRRDDERKAREYQDHLINGDGGTKYAPASDHYAAIAYSPSTKNWGYSYNYSSLQAAQNAAVSHCKAADAKPMGWASNGAYCALALGTNGAYACGYGPTAQAAQNNALAECAKFGADCKVVKCVRSN